VKRGARGVRDVLGVPALPPARATAATNRLRGALARLHRGLAPPPVRVIESMLGILDHAALVALCRLDVPDRLVRATRVDVLAGELGVDPDGLDRLLRFAALRGWVRVGRSGRVAPTRALRFVRRDHPGGWRAWVDFAGGEEVVRAAGALDVAVRDGRDPFAHVHGEPFFGWMSARPDRQAAFDAAMAAGARMHGLVLAHTLDWSAGRVVCDVGGGTGALLATLVAAHPHLHGILLDLPSVVARAEPAPNVRVVAGDAFTAVPGGADTYLFVNVVHDWGDADARRLLRNARDAGGAEARIVVVEGERRAVPLDDVAARSDLLMLALTPGGRERTAGEMAALGAAAGLRLQAAPPLPSGDRAYVFGA
jgi:hypothetical protein